jgi:DNA-binding CsgD family transcriptional regulator
LQHYLSAGRSVDSAKRREGSLQITFDSETGEGFPEQADSGNSVTTNVSAREIITLLSSHLKPQEKAVLDCLAEGLGAREIGRELKISHTMVIRYRRRIACLLTKLESTTKAIPSDQMDWSRHAQKPSASATKSRSGFESWWDPPPGSVKRLPSTNGNHNGNGHRHANGVPPSTLK